MAVGHAHVNRHRARSAVTEWVNVIGAPKAHTHAAFVKVTSGQLPFQSSTFALQHENTDCHRCCHVRVLRLCRVPRTSRPSSGRQEATSTWLSSRTGKKRPLLTQKINLRINWSQLSSLCITHSGVQTFGSEGLQGPLSEPVHNLKRRYRFERGSALAYAPAPKAEAHPRSARPRQPAHLPSHRPVTTRACTGIRRRTISGARDKVAP